SAGPRHRARTARSATGRPALRGAPPARAKPARTVCRRACSAIARTWTLPEKIHRTKAVYPAARVAATKIFFGGRCLPEYPDEPEESSRGRAGGRDEGQPL